MGRRPLSIDKLAMDLIFTDEVKQKEKLFKKILSLAYKRGIYPSSIHELYMAFGRGEVSGFYGSRHKFKEYDL